MNRTDRLYAITSALRTAGSRGRTAAWLAKKFEVSTRTIKRDIAALLQTGLPINAQDGRGGGYQLMRSAVLPPVTFSSGEATAVAIALSADPQLPFAADGAAALDKLLGAMNRIQREEATDMAGRVWMRSAEEQKRSRTARVLDEALRKQVLILMDYEDGRGRISKKRPVEPMAFVRTREQWQLLAWCHTRGAGRWFRLDRVKKAWLTKTPCTPRILREVFGDPPDWAQPVKLPG